MKKAAKEFLVIVLGVLTALTGESLWGDAQDRQLAEVCTARLLEDLRSDSSALSRASDYLVRVDTWEDLAGTGRLGLLSDDDRQALRQYYGPFAILVDRDTPLGYREAVAGAVSADAWSGIADVCVLYPAAGQPLRPCEIDPEWHLEDVPLAVARVDGVQQDLNRLMVELSQQMRGLEFVRRRSAQAIAALEGTAR